MDNPAKLPAPFPHYLSPTGFTDDLQTRSSSTHVKSVDDSASSGIQPRILETNVSNDERFKPHQSSLPLFLYLLSFAATAQDSIDPTLNKTRSWRETFSHPFVLYGIGTFAAILAGMAFPAFDILYGYWTTGITASTATTSQITARGIQTAWIMAIVGSMILLTTWAFPICFVSASHHLTGKLRETYVASIIVQDAAFFEKIGPGEISMRATKDVAAIRTAFGEKLGFLVWSLSTIFTAIISSFINSPRLAGVLFSLVPFVMLVFGFLGWANNVIGRPANKFEGQTSSLVEQILSSIRVVQSSNMGPSLIKRLDTDLFKRLQKLGSKRSIIRSLQQSSIYFALFLTYSLAFWYGGIEVKGGLATGHVVTAFFNYVNLLWTLSSVVPHVTRIQDAMVSLREIRRQIERQPFIDVRDGSGIKLPAGSVEPSFELQHVTFAYPGRPSVPALDNVSLRINVGMVTSIVGPSGSGKSTVASLLLREFDPETANTRNKNDPAPEKVRNLEDGGTVKKDEKARLRSDGVEKLEIPADSEVPVKGSGKVLFAGRDVREYNLRWLRSQVAVVSQSPQLFTGTVFENIAAGLTGTDHEYRLDIDGADDAGPAIKERTAKIRELCSEALQKAQAIGFVSRLPEGMDTMISGGRNGVLSGGQRQRIAIARALVRKPACLVLDEATSALDTETEEAIRLMLEEERKERGMTTVIIAHRLSTIAKADCIIVMKDGRVVDEGRYENLMDKNRLDQTFRQLAIAQRAETNIEYVRVPVNHVGIQEGLDVMPSGVISPVSRISSAAPSTYSVLPIDIETAAPLELERDERLFRRFLTLLKSQKWFFTIGVLAGLVAGGSMPVSGWMLGESIHSLSNRFARTGVNTWSLWFMVMAFIDLFIYFFNAYYLEVASENIMRKLKRDSLGTLVKQEIGFFDQADSSAGGLTSAVSTHPANVGAATGIVTAQLLLLTANLLGSVLVGMILSWKMAVVCVPPIFVLFFSGWLNVAMHERYETAISAPTAKIANHVNEIADSIKTVAALGREREIVRVFHLQVRLAPRGIRSLVLGSAGLGLSQGTCLLTGSLMFYWFSQRLAGGAAVRDVFAVFESIAVAQMSAARVLTFVGDYARAIHSFKAIQIWMRRKPRHSVCDGPIPTQESSSDWASGDIVLNHVEMCYPQRPDHPALQDINLRFVAGQTHSLCGPSGNGKSSIMALLQRFYDPSRGTITFGGTDHRQIPLDDLRASMAYVSQDSVLFEGTIRWNLSLGALDPATVTEDQIQMACKQAYIWDFVRGLTKGLDTEVGMKGLSLSGGQRQRLCIARALIRNPKILLLDEATSALDGQAEKYVQKALDNARAGRTTIMIAHRLSTIRNSDVIHVIEDGYVCESGSHKQLVEKRGRYFELVQAQL